MLFLGSNPVTAQAKIRILHANIHMKHKPYFDDDGDVGDGLNRYCFALLPFLDSRTYSQPKLQPKRMFEKREWVK